MSAFYIDSTACYNSKRKRELKVNSNEANQNTELQNQGAQPEVAETGQQLPKEEPKPSQPVLDPGKSVLIWSATEYLHHDKNFLWYGGVLVAGVAIGGATYLITEDAFSAAIMPIVAVIVAIFGARKPKELPYEITENGISINGIYRPFSDFKTFTIIHEGQFSSLMLQPVKRFMPSLSVYFAPDNAEQVIEVLSQHMPHEEGKIDAVERLARHLRL